MTKIKEEFRIRHSPLAFFFFACVCVCVCIPSTAYTDKGLRLFGRLS